MQPQLPPLKKTKWQQKREASYLALIESAMHQFGARGYAATRVEDIVEGTGYTSGAFYFHFTNKAECFWHVIEHRQTLRGDWSRVTDGLNPATTPLADILTHVFGYFDKTDEGIHNWFLVMVDFHQQHRDEPDAQERLTAIYDLWHTEIRRFVTNLQQGGWIDTDRDPDRLTTQLFAATEGLQSHAALYRLEPNQAEDALIEMLARILTGPA